jgi:hypothetical protein
MGTVLGGISQICGIEYDIASGGFRCAFTEKGAEIEGISSLSSFSSECVTVNLKRGKLEIKGENLSIGALSKGYIAICGTVSSTRLL